MGFEIERKYLVKNRSYIELETGSEEICQGYLSRNPERTVRVRTRADRGYITVKGLTRGEIRLEYEYEIPYTDARQMLKLCERPVIRKVRHLVPWQGHIWEVDEFQGDMAPLILAEIELATPDETYELPPFVGEEVTGNPAYYNSNMGKKR